MNYRRTMLVVMLLLGASALACVPGLEIGQSSKPVVEIISPLNGSEVGLGEEAVVLFRAEDEVGISRVELEANGEIVAVTRSARTEGEPSMRATLTWTPTVPGAQTLLVHAYNTEGVISDAVGVTVVVVTSASTPTTLQPAPGETTVPTPGEGQGVPTTQPPMPGETAQPATAAPPTVAPPTATIAASPTAPRPPTPTQMKMTCPTITINVPSRAFPSRVFTLEWDSNPHALPSGWQWGIRFKGAEDTWTYLAVPLDSPAREEGGHWKADYLRGRGAEETLYWQACLVNMSDPARAFECCGPVPPWPILHAR
ncbi:MAG TPA: hypothetical protein ENO24_09295 [Chloroflexi bacterium]|nr:hypothetical protein [Chloroflexota bacterium]